jgi:uncharacterized phiE125 gp8 family phage protein
MKHNEGCDLVNSLVSVREFKGMYGVDDREDSLVEFLLVSSTYAIEEYCMRRLLRKRIKERFEASGYLTLREYPVREVLAVDIIHADGSASPAYYDLSPEAGALVNVPHILRPLPPDYALRGKTISVKYIAGYSMKDVTPDLKEACFELTAWKYQRHTNRFTFIAGKKEAGFENKMPERVKELLSPYRRKTL